MRVPVVLPASPVKTPQVMQEGELLNTSEKENSQVRKFKKEKEVIAE